MSVIRPYRGGGFEGDIRITYPTGETYRERRRIPVKSRSAAQRWVEARERHLLLSGPPKPKKEVPTLQDFAPRFLDGHARANQQKASSISQKEVALRVHLIPALGGKPLNRITTEDVQRLKHALRDRAPKTVNNILTVLNTMLKKGVEWGVIERMSCVIRLLKTSAGGLDFYDFDEYRRLVEGARLVDSTSHVAVLLGGDAGLRAGEMRALRWTDVDLEKGQLRIECNEWRGHITTTKGNRIRYVPMTTRLREALQHHRHLRGQRVLYRADGQPMSASALIEAIQRAARRANLRNNGPHILRHTFCSHLAMRGAAPRAIQELAGHRDVGTTQRYMHLSPAATRSAIQLLERPIPGATIGDILETEGSEKTNVNG
jgi:integrase